MAGRFQPRNTGHEAATPWTGRQSTTNSAVAKIQGSNPKLHTDKMMGFDLKRITYSHSYKM